MTWCVNRFGMQPGSQPFTGRTHRHSPSSLHLRSGQMAAVGPPMSECCNGESGCPTLTLWALRQTMPQHGRRESALRPKCTVGAQLGEQFASPPSIPLRVTASTTSAGCGCKRRSRSGRYLKETCALGNPFSHDIRAPGRTRNPNLLADLSQSPMDPTEVCRRAHGYDQAGIVQRTVSRDPKPVSEHKPLQKHTGAFEAESTPQQFNHSRNGATGG